MRSLLTGLGLALAATLSTTPLLADDIKVLSAGAYKAVLMGEIPAFEKQTGHTVSVTGDTAGGLIKRIKSGEAFDLVVLTGQAVEELLRTGELAAGSPRPLARVGIGVAVRKGAPLPDISTEAAFKQAVVSARAVAMVDPAAGGTSGIYLVRLYERWGIAAQVMPKAVLVPGGYSAERLVNGEADLAVQQMSELVAVPGAQIVGYLPADVQRYTVYTGAIGTNAARRTAAMQLLDALDTPGVRSGLESRGMSAP